MGALCQIVSNSQTLDQIRDALGFTKEDLKILSLQTFILMVLNPLESYHDLNFNNWKIFITKVNELFPDQTEEDKKLLTELETRIRNRFLEIYPHLNVQKKSTSKDIVSDLSKYFDVDIKERLSVAFKIENANHPDSIYEKGEALQFILNVLILEKDLIDYATTFVEDMLQLNSLRNLLKREFIRFINFDGQRGAIFFEVPNNLEESKDFEFWLSLSPYLALVQDNDRTFATVCMDKISIFDFKKFLLQLKEKPSSENVVALVEHWFECVEYIIYERKISKNMKLLQLICELPDSALASRETDHSPYLLNLISPFYDHIIKLYEEILTNTRNFHFLPKNEDLLKMKAIIDYWETQKINQKEMFNIANTELQDLIEQNPKQKRQLLKFTKDLTGPAKYACGPMRCYPDDIIILEDKKIEISPNISFEKEEANLVSKKSKAKNKKQLTKKELKKTTKSNFQANSSLPKIEVKNGIVNIETKEKKVGQPTLISATQPSKDEFKEIVPEIPGSPFPYFNDARVQRWDNHPFGEPLLQEEFPEYCNMSSSQQELMHLFHAPHDLVNSFISLGIKGEWLNVKRGKVDIRYSIPSEIEYNGKKRKGLINFSIDKETNVCYHRCFTEKLGSEIFFQTVKKVFKDHDFPELEYAIEINQTSESKKIISGATVALDKYTGNVTIEDSIGDKKIVIKLFKVS